MNNQFMTCVENAIGDVEFARSSALRECVFGVPNFYTEFRDSLSSQFDHDEYRTKIREFIRSKNLRIISEKPVARIKDDRYAIDVYFTITW